MAIERVWSTPRNSGWEVMLFRLPAGLASPMDWGPGLDPVPLGTPEEITALIEGAEPAVEWTGLGWGWVWSLTWSIEVMLLDPDPNGMAVWVRLTARGRGDDVVARMVRLAEVLGCIAFDVATASVVLDGADVGAWRACQRECEQPSAHDQFDVHGRRLRDVAPD